MNDQGLAQLISIFEDKPVEYLQKALIKHQTVERTIEFLLRDQAPKNALELLSSKEVTMKKMNLSVGNISRFLPAVMIERFLDDDLANCLLLDMMQESEEWHVRNFSLFGKNVQSPHTTAFYIDESRKTFGNQVSDSEQSYYTGIPGHKSKTRLFLPRMIMARNIVEEKVQKVLNERIKHSLELQELWQSNIVVANRYKNHEQGVGAHADRLTFIGPMPTIASLTLGAERVFRVKKIISQDSSPAIFDILLPHNSLLIMLPPFQEEYKHELPKCKPTGVKPHRLSGSERLNLTFRVARPNYCEKVAFCKCGNPCDLRTVSKKEKNRGKYFYMCAMSGSTILNKPMGYNCNHFEWLVEN